jgi:hypothetical protein
MKKLYILTLIILPVGAYCQSAIPLNIRAQITAERLSSQNWEKVGNSIVGIPIPPGDVVGDVYLDSKWNLGSIMVDEKKTLVEGYPMKYDLKSQNIEIKTSSGIRVLGVKNVAHMVWLDSITRQPRYFVNAARYKEDGVPMIGLMEVLFDGEKALLKKTKLNVRQPTYVPAMDVGSRDTKLYKKSAYYYNNGTEVVEIKSKKKFIDSLGDHGSEVGQYMKENRLDVKTETDLVKIFEFYNSKIQQG